MHTGSSATYSSEQLSDFTHMYRQLRYYINFPIVALYRYIYYVLILLFDTDLCIWLWHQMAMSPSQVDTL